MGANAACSFILQYVEEYSELKKSRHSNRPASAREDLLKLKVSALETEYKQGFGMTLNLLDFPCAH